MDGSRVALGSSSGSVIFFIYLFFYFDGFILILPDCVALFDACLRRIRYKGKYEFVYTSGSQVIVSKLATNANIVLKSEQGNEISRIRIFRDNFLIAFTPNTLMLGDLGTYDLSEVCFC
jgi:hypothetical protein